MPFKIRTKLITAFIGLISVILGITGGIAYYNQRALHKAIQCSEDAGERIQLVNIFQLALDRVLMPGNDYIITGDRKYVSEFETASYGMENGIKMVEESMAHLRGSLKAGDVKEEEEIFKDVKLAWQNIKEISQKIFEIQNPQATVETQHAASLLMEEMDYRWAYPAIKRLDRLNEMSRKGHKEGIEAAYKTWRHSWIIMGVGALFLFAAGISFALLYSRLFVGPIKKLHNGADAIAAGNFKTRLDIKTGDEIEQLSNAMNEMAEQLDAFTANLQGMVEERTADLRESEERYRGIFEKTPNAMVVFDAETLRFENVNNGAVGLYGYTEEEFLSLTPVDVSAEVEKTRKSVQNGLVEESAHVPVRYHKKKDGTVFPVEIFMGTFLSGGRRKGFAVVVDLTEIKKAEETLRYERDKLIKIFEAMEDGVYIVNQNYDIEYINPFLEKEYGPWKGIKCYTYFHDRTEVCPWCPNQRVFAGETVRWEWYSFKNGKTYDLLDTALRNPDGSLSKLEIFRDITDKKKAEETLKESEERYRTMIDTSNDWIWTLTPDGRLTFINKQTEDVSGYSKEEWLGKTFEPLILEDDLAMVVDIHNKVVKGEKAHYEVRVKRKDGGVIILSVNASPIFKEDKVTGTISFGRDITDRKKAEEALKQRIKELEEFRKVTIKRELRMEELQRKVEEMETKLGVRSSGLEKKA